MLKSSLLILSVLIMAGSAKALELEGIVLGGPLEDALLRHPKAKCEDKSVHAVFDKKCGTAGKLAGKDITLIFPSKKGAVGAINAVFNPQDYDHILRELTSLKGNPGQVANGIAVWSDSNSDELTSLEKQYRTMPRLGVWMLMDLRHTKRDRS